MALTESEWDALLGSWSCDYCEPEKAGLREEFDALLAIREVKHNESCATTDQWQDQKDAYGALVERIEALKGVQPSYFDERALVVSIDNLRAILKES